MLQLGPNSLTPVTRLDCIWHLSLLNCRVCCTLEAQGKERASPPERQGLDDRRGCLKEVAFEFEDRAGLGHAGM